LNNVLVKKRLTGKLSRSVRRWRCKHDGAASIDGAASMNDYYRLGAVAKIKIAHKEILFTLGIFHWEHLATTTY